MTAWVASEAELARVNPPSGESLTTTRLGTTWLPLKLRSLARGRVGMSAGYRVTWPPVVVAAWTAVTLRTRATGASGPPAAGIAPVPAAWYLRASLTRGPVGDCRVSSRREGGSPTNLVPPVADPGAVYQPLTSTTTWEVPAWLSVVIVPSGPTGTRTRLARVSPVRKLRLEVEGRDCPLGEKVKWVDAVGRGTGRV